MDKSRVVEHVRLVRHPLYGKQVRRRKRYMVHDPENVSNVGDAVIIEESRPLSARKRWRLREVIPPPVSQVNSPVQGNEDE